MNITTILLAAGNARRMGVDKLALPIQGERLIHRAIAPFVASALVREVLLVVKPTFVWPDHHPAACQLVTNDAFETGMASSIRAGILATPTDSDAYLIALADMPGLSMATLGQIIQTYGRCGKPILQPWHRGQPGHPVLLHRDFRAQLLALEGDVGARAILESHRSQVHCLELEDPGVVWDVDRPADLEEPPVGERAAPNGVNWDVDRLMDLEKPPIGERAAPNGVNWDVDRPTDREVGRPQPHARRSPNQGTPAQTAINHRTRPLRVLIKGAGEMASSVAHRLHRCGFRVVMTEIERPTAIRRQVAFARAIQEGEATVEGVVARGIRLDRVGDHPDQLELLDGLEGSFIPVVVDPDCTLVARWRPNVLIDGRILKRNVGNSMEDAPLVIGLGPGLRAGRDVHVVVETQRGHDLARVLTVGEAQPNTGVPGEIAHRSFERLLRAPSTGRFQAKVEIGTVLQPGDLVGWVGEDEVRAAIGGVLRGLIHPGDEVQQGQKIGDVDPRGEVAFCHTISDKARNISGACLEAILCFLREWSGEDCSGHRGPPP